MNLACKFGVAGGLLVIIACLSACSQGEKLTKSKREGEQLWVKPRQSKLELTGALAGKQIPTKLEVGGKLDPDLPVKLTPFKTSRGEFALGLLDFGSGRTLEMVLLYAREGGFYTLEFICSKIYSPHLSGGKLILDVKGKRLLEPVQGHVSTEFVILPSSVAADEIQGSSG